MRSSLDPLSHRKVLMRIRWDRKCQRATERNRVAVALTAGQSNKHGQRQRSLKATNTEGSSSERREQTDRKPLWLCLSVGQSMINMLKAEIVLLAVGDN